MKSAPWLDGQAIGRERVFGAITAGAAMGDDDQALVVVATVFAVGAHDGLGGAGGDAEDQQRERADGMEDRQVTLTHGGNLIAGKGSADTPVRRPIQHR